MTQKLTGFPNVVNSLAFSTDGSALIISSSDGTLRIYSTSDYKQLNFETTSPGGIETLAISPDGGLLATAGVTGEVHLWKVVYHP